MKAYFSLLFALAVLLSGCVKNEIKVEFHLAKDLNTPYRVLYYASDKKRGMIQETVAEINGGEGLLTLPTRYPSFVFLFSPAQTEPGLVFFAERGDKISISGDDTNMVAWSVEGNKINEEWTAWRKENKVALSSGDAAKINDAIAKYVKKNPESALSLILLSIQFNRREDTKQFASLYSSLKPKAFDNKELVKALAIGDLLEGITSEIKTPSQVILHGNGGYADTLKLKAGAPSIIVFRNGRERGELDEQNDSMKALRKDFPDSAAYIIAEIITDPDSSQWRRTIVKDTLKNITRMWMPLGVSAHEAIELGIPRIPYYLVTDGSGRRLYEGSDLKKAAETYRKTAKTVKTQ